MLTGGWNHARLGCLPPWLEEIVWYLLVAVAVVGGIALMIRFPILNLVVVEAVVAGIVAMVRD